MPKVEIKDHPKYRKSESNTVEVFQAQWTNSKGQVTGSGWKGKAEATKIASIHGGWVVRYWFAGFAM